MRSRMSIVLLFVMIITLIMVGCGKSIRRTFVRENIDLGFVNRVAVLPLENNSADKFVAERVRNSIATQVLERGIFDVVDKGILDNALREEAIEPGSPIELNSLKRIGQRLNVQGFIIGSVDEATEERKGAYSYAVMSLTLRLLETTGGTVLWQANGSRSAGSALGRLFGLDAKDAFYNTDKLVKSLVRTIPK